MEVVNRDSGRKRLLEITTDDKLKKKLAYNNASFFLDSKRQVEFGLSIAIYLIYCLDNFE